MTRGTPSAAAAADSAGASPGERLLLILLLGLLCVRPLLPESYEHVDVPFASGADGFGPTRAATVWLDWLTLLIASVSVARRGMPSRRVAITVAMLVLAAVLSTLAADSKRVALNAVATLCAFAMVGAALPRMIRARDQAMLLIAAMLASCATNAVKCATQRAYEFNDTLAAWEEQKTALAARGEPLDDSAIVNFDRRLRSRNAFGYVAHPNVAASLMAMGAAAAVAFVIGGLRSPRRPVALLGGLALAAALGIAIWFTGSKGALVALVGGCAALPLCVIGWPTRRLFNAICAGYVLLIAGVAGYGLARGTLPGASLAFRWEYWTAAMRALPEAKAGLGRENFIAAHMHYKSPTATEEVRNPHNIWVSLMIELGPVGFAGGGALLLAALWLAARGTSQPPSGAPQAWPRRWELAAAAGAALGLHAWFSGTPFGSSGILVIWLIETALVWAVAFLLALVVIGELAASRGGLRWIAAAGVAVALVGLLHNLVDFSLLAPAGLAVFVVLALVPGLLTPRDTAEPAPRFRMFRAGIAAAATIAVFAIVVYPTTQAETLAQESDRVAAKATSAADLERSEAIGLAAVAADGMDADIPRQLGRRCYSQALQRGAPGDWQELWLTRAAAHAKTAFSRAPRSVASVRLMARIDDELARLEHERGKEWESKSRLVEAADGWLKVVRLYPTSAQDRVEAGLSLFRLWKATLNIETAYQAMDQFQVAKDIDALRPAENASRLRPAEISAMLETLEAMRPAVIERAGNAGATSSAPASRP
ncbi:MAG: O-antigen ligase family protein [Planctomycetes bacterium]|nr:O-antigen ligase family protein [Planctomycetota bacterium]